MIQNYEEKRPEVYLSETWTNAHHSKDKAWVEQDEITGGTLRGIQHPSGKGNNMVVLNVK